MHDSRADTETGLIALDWGTSALRAWLVSRSGAILDRRRRDWGILHLPEGGFPAAFADITSGWGAPGIPALACGMVGSRQGWREVPYVPTPAGLSQLGDGLVAVETGAGITLHLVPGVIDTNDPRAPDVMRGEETQAMGALEKLGGSGLLIMPGTHSKWANLSNGRLVSLRTLMTGELFALLREHSILGRGLAEAPPADAAALATAFRDGVLAGHAQGAFARLFSIRALNLTGQLATGCVPDYLSGLLIGEELRSAGEALWDNVRSAGEALGIDWRSAGEALRGDLRSAGAALRDAPRIAITGDALLCERYGRAFTAIGIPEPERIADTALDGLLLIATRAGLLGAT